MNLTVLSSAPPDTVFSPGAFDHAVGRAYPLRQPDGSNASAVLLAANVVDEGRAVELAFSIPDPTPEAPR